MESDTRRQEVLMHLGNLVTIFADANGDHRADAIVFNAGSPMIVGRSVIFCTALLIGVS